MKPNSIIIKEFFEKVISVGSEIASKKFVMFVLNNLLEEEKKTHEFLQYIKFGDEIYIDPKVDSYLKEELVDPLNKMFDYLFLDTSKKMLRDTIDNETYNEFKKFGFHI